MRESDLAKEVLLHLQGVVTAVYHHDQVLQKAGNCMEPMIRESLEEGCFPHFLNRAPLNSEGGAKACWHLS